MNTFPSHIEFVLVWLLCTTMFNSGMCTLKAQCNEKDKHTLLSFKQGITDPSGLLSSWFTEPDCCRWMGVQCDNVTGRVTDLSLPCHTNQPVLSDKDDKSHCLTGELDLSLLDLEFLSYLNLSNNDFKAIQYDSIGSQKCNNLSRFTPPYHCEKSSNLRYLDLSYNYDISIDNLNWISPLSSLEYLNLNYIDLFKETNWLQSVTVLPSLLELLLEGCQLRNVYPSLQYANFTSLQVLDLADNDFISELPSWLFNLSCDISHVDLSSNNIQGQLSKTLPNFQSIKSLILFGNNLDGPIPDWLGQLKHLRELDLSDNLFSGPIPTSLANLSSLTVLELVANHLNESLPESLGQLFNLKALGLADNSFTGIFSERNVLSLSNLKEFSFGSPALIIDFDTQWVPPFQLQKIALLYISPKLPSWLFTQSSLKRLVIFNSRASLESEGKFLNFAELDFLHLHNTTINGDMSNVLLDSKIAWLSSNNLRGGLPRISPNVVFLNLANNSLSGSISPLLCHKMKAKSNLKYLMISNNHLSGGLTDCWMYWKSLVHVDLANNNLSGKIPHSMGLLSKLVSLHLNDNNFFGDVPVSLKNCQNLWILNLGENEFSGTIPNWLGRSMQALQLRSNKFSGNIPPQICQLNSLTMLDFADNRLSGPIPNCLYNMTAMFSDNALMGRRSIPVQDPDSNIIIIFSITVVTKGNKLNQENLMYVLDLSSNTLSGTMPPEIFRLTRLQSLNLSCNQLVGPIPEEIGNLKQLESIDLSSNRLSGEIPQSLSALSFLEVLNLSFNSFMGKIPSGTQLQSFTALSYMGNPELCGPPLTKYCPQDEKPFNTKPMGEDEDESDVHSCFYMGMGVGFAVGFWAVFTVIFFNRRCRHAYFRFLSNMEDKLYAMVIRKMNVVR